MAPPREPPSPQVLLLGAGGTQMSKPRRVSGDEFGWTITFSFPIGNHAYSWNWTACSRPAEATDGIGLPGQNGCGSERTRASAAGMLASPCTHVHPCAGPAPGIKASAAARPDIRTGTHTGAFARPTAGSPSATHPPSTIQPPTHATVDHPATANNAVADHQPPLTTQPPPTSAPRSSAKDLVPFLGLLAGSISLAVLPAMGMSRSRRPGTGVGRK